MDNVIDCCRAFEVRRVVNLSLRLVNDLGYANRVKVIIETNQTNKMGFEIVMFDTMNHQKLVVDPQRIIDYYDFRSKN